MQKHKVEFDRPPITLKQARQIASCAFGEQGETIVDLWKAYNQKYFWGKLKPVPVLFVPTSPYGHWIGICVGANRKKSALIYLKDAEPWEGIRCTLLHEMIHQYLFESGRNSSHASQDWCNEIMRISREGFGVEFWAGRYTVGKKRLKDGSRISVRMNKRGPKGEASISMTRICSWPDSKHLLPPDLKDI